MGQLLTRTDSKFAKNLPGSIRVWYLCRMYVLPLTTLLLCFAACSGGQHQAHHILGKDRKPLPPVRMLIPATSKACNLARPTKDSSSIVWLRFLPNRFNWETKEVSMLHIYATGSRFLLTMFYPRPNGLYGKDSSFTSILRKTAESPDTVAMTASSVTYYYVTATHEWYYNNPREHILQVPSLKEVNRCLSDYISHAARNDSATIVRFGGTTMHRIYMIKGVVYDAHYSLLGADIVELKQSAHPLGTRFDYLDNRAEHLVYSMLERPFSKSVAAVGNDFRKHLKYYVVGKKDSTVYCFNLGTDSLMETFKPFKTWQYKYSYYDSVFYFGAPWVDAVYKF